MEERQSCAVRLPWALIAEDISSRLSVFVYLCICVCVFVFVYLYERETKLRSALPWALMVEANTKPTILERLKPIYKPSLEKLRGEIKQQDRQRWRYV